MTIWDLDDAHHYGMAVNSNVTGRVATNILYTLLSATLAFASIKMHYIPSVAQKALL